MGGIAACWACRTGIRCWPRFVARCAHAPLQAWASTPGAAIPGLRRCATDYQQQIAQVALPFPSSARAVTREPIPPWRGAAYQVFVAIVGRRKGYWQQAHDLTEEARYYQRGAPGRCCRALICPFSFWSARRKGPGRMAVISM
ncbi:hypothetical protein [Cupriavidus sp. amp6]|uniref:hypothetical protein n=1 Tax=Cupriavidus sp. amp6 TaxID=388051 RepID=UPI00048F43C1|nr:hypothetical protein [Cupriavidus sp. amp6]